MKTVESSKDPRARVSALDRSSTWQPSTRCASSSTFSPSGRVCNLFYPQKVAHLLNLAGSTLAAVHPDNISPATFGLAEDDSAGSEANEEDTENVFKERAAEYFGTLNVTIRSILYILPSLVSKGRFCQDIQKTLRTAIWAIRATRTSVQPILDPSSGTVTKGQVGGGAAVSDGDNELSIGANRFELQAWRDLNSALLGLETQLEEKSDTDTET
jgi:hypothetical protein